MNSSIRHKRNLNMFLFSCHLFPQWNIASVSKTVSWNESSIKKTELVGVSSSESSYFQSLIELQGNQLFGPIKASENITIQIWWFCCLSLSLSLSLFFFSVALTLCTGKGFCVRDTLKSRKMIQSFWLVEPKLRRMKTNRTIRTGWENSK